MRVAAHLTRPTRELVRAARCGSKPHVPLFGLAPGGVYHAIDVATDAVRSYRTISPLPTQRKRGLAVYFLWHFPWTRAPQELPGTLPYGARTFLPCGDSTGAAVRPTPKIESTTIEEARHRDETTAKTRLVPKIPQDPLLDQYDRIFKIDGD